MLTAVVRPVASVTRHGSGPDALTEKIVPVTSAQVTPMEAPEMGLDPTSPVMTELGTSVMPDFDRIANEPAAPRFTGAWADPTGAVVVPTGVVVVLTGVVVVPTGGVVVVPTGGVVVVVPTGGVVVVVLT